MTRLAKNVEPSRSTVHREQLIAASQASTHIRVAIAQLLEAIRVLEKLPHGPALASAVRAHDESIKARELVLQTLARIP